MPDRIIPLRAIVVCWLAASFGERAEVPPPEALSFFQARRHYWQSSPNELAAADFNRDGKADLAIADSYLGMQIRLGRGDGTSRK